MSKKVIYKVSISRHVREVATFYVEADDSIDPDTVNETELAEAVYEAEAGEAACLWETDVEYGADRGTCTAERYTGRKYVKANYSRNADEIEDALMNHFDLYELFFEPDEYIKVTREKAFVPKGWKTLWRPM